MRIVYFILKYLKKIKLPSFDKIAVIGIFLSIIGTYYSAFEWLEADFNGDWDSSKALNVIYNKTDFKNISTQLSECNDNDCNNIKPKLIEFTPDQNTVLIALETEQKYITRHTNAIISIFEFKKNKFGWILSLSDIGSFHAGNFGFSTPEDLEIKYIGNDIYGIFVKEVNPGMGGNSSHIVNIYARLKDSYVKVLSYYSHLTSEHENRTSGGLINTQLTGKLNIIKSNSSGFYDMKIDVSYIKFHFLSGLKATGAHDLSYELNVYFNGRNYIPRIDTEMIEKLQYQDDFVLINEEID